MANATTRELIDRLADIWTDELAPAVVDNACVLASRTAVEVLGYFGVAAEAVPVQAVWCNAEAFPLIRDEVPVGDWPEGAWSVGVGHGGRDTNGYNAHVMTYVDGEGWLDLSVKQFSRPERDMPLPDALFLSSAEDDRPPRDRGWRHAQIDGVHLIWQEIDDDAHKQGGDWKRGYRRFAAHAIRRMKESA